MKKQFSLLLSDAVLNIVAVIAVTAITPVVLLLTPLINIPAAIVILCIGAALLYAGALSKMAQKAMEKSGVRFWQYTLFSVLPAVIAPLGVSSFCLIEWLNRPPVSYQLDLFIAAAVFVSVIVMFAAYLLMHLSKKSASADGSSAE